MDDVTRELFAFLDDWREKHDLRASDMVAKLQAAIDHYGPKK